MTARDMGTRASRLLGIRDEVAAFSFDLAVSLRLFSFDNERAEAQAKMVAREVGKMLFGSKDDDVLNASIIGDKYADGNTQVW